MVISTIKKLYSIDIATPLENLGIEKRLIFALLQHPVKVLKFSKTVCAQKKLKLPVSFEIYFAIIFMMIHGKIREHAMINAL